MFEEASRIVDNLHSAKEYSDAQCKQIDAFVETLYC